MIRRAVIAIAACIAGCSPTPPAVPRETFLKEPIDQTVRLDLLQEAQAANIISGFDCDPTATRLDARPAFQDLRLDQKQVVVWTLVTFCYTGQEDDLYVTIRDDRTGEPIGHFNRQYGLKLD